MTDKLNLLRSVQVKNGLIARYLGTLAHHPYPHVIAVQQLMGNEFVAQFDDYGNSQTEEFSLINVPETKRSGEVLVNIYDMGFTGDVLATSNTEPTTKRLARILLSWTEGEGFNSKDEQYARWHDEQAAALRRLKNYDGTQPYEDKIRFHEDCAAALRGMRK